MPVPPGAAGEIALAKFGRDTRVVENSVLAVAGAVTRLVKSNPDRVQLVIINMDVDIIAFSSKQTVSALNGVRLPPGGTAVLTADEDGDLVAYEIWMFQQNGTNNVYTLEVIADL